MIEHIIELIAPHHCLGCGQAGTLLCSECEQDIVAAPGVCYRCGKQQCDKRLCVACSSNTPLAALYAAARYEGHAKKLVQKLKFDRATAAAEPMARLMAKSIPLHPEMIVVPVPTASSRVRARGYDQAARIAMKVAKQLNLSYAPLLSRIGQQRQVGSDKVVRQKQMQNAFQLHGKQLYEHKTVLLIDDVLTTGSTIEAAARTLRQRGFADIRAAVFAAAE